MTQKGSATPQICEDGKYSLRQGQSACDDCPAGIVCDGQVGKCTKFCFSLDYYIQKFYIINTREIYPAIQ